MVTLELVLAARERIAPYVVRTPTVEQRRLAELLGRPVALKLELLQHSGSFETRGAFNRMLLLDEGERAAGVVAVSGGNHGLAVAYAARALHLRASLAASRRRRPTARRALGVADRDTPAGPLSSAHCLPRWCVGCHGRGSAIGSRPVVVHRSDSQLVAVHRSPVAAPVRGAAQHGGQMDRTLSRMLVDGCGVVERASSRGSPPTWAIGHAVAAGELVRVLPRTYVAAGLEDDPVTLRRAALRYAGSGAALSHLTALEHWKLPVPSVTRREPVHVTVPPDRRLRATGAVRVHRRKGFGSAKLVARDGLPVVVLDRAVVESWPLLPVDDRLVPCMAAINGRRTTAGRLRKELATLPNLTDRANLDRVLKLVEAGCRSWLEILGCLEVFEHPSLPPSRAQVPVRIGSRTIYLDRLYEEELVNVELDGTESHGSQDARERDRRRDAALALLGILVVRYTHRRLVHETVAVRVELARILATRRQQLRIG